jgi:YbbR domain-containing protein
MIPTLRKLVLQDLWLKLFSFALAVLIWFTVNFATKSDVSPVASLSLAPREQRTFRELPVLVMCPAADLRGFVVTPKTVEVTVEGDANLLQKLQEKEIHVVLDLTGIGSAQDLRKRIDVSTPAGVKAVRADPEEVQVAFPPKS